MKLFATISLVTVCCVSSPAISTQSNGTFVIDGLYKYSDGDRIVWRCRKRTECMDVVIRDSRLAQSATKLLNHRVSIRVRRVKACGPESTQVACLRSNNGTALLIVEWLDI